MKNVRNGIYLAIAFGLLYLNKADARQYVFVTVVMMLVLIVEKYMEKKDV